MRQAIFLLALGLLTKAHAQVPTCTTCSSDATSVVNLLARQNLNCNFAPVSAQRGYRCRGRIAGYSQPVNFYLAPGLMRDRPVYIGYHFHGFSGDTAPDMTFDYPDGDFAAWIATSKKNVVIIVPESLGKNKTYADELGTAAKMNAFINQAETALSTAGLTTTLATPRLVSGHSGAYVQMGNMGEWAASGAVPALKSIVGVGMFDTNYGYRAGNVAMMDVACHNASAAYYIASKYNDGDATKRSVNERIQREITHAPHTCAKAKVTYIKDTTTVHWRFPVIYFASYLTATIP